MQTSLAKSPLLRAGTAVLVLGSIFCTYFLTGPRNRKRQTEVFEKTQEDLDQNLIAPANATFPIVWSVIYPGHLALAFHQALPAQLNNPRYGRAMPWLAVSYTLNALFGYFFAQDTKTGRVGGSLTTIATLLPALLLHRQLEEGRTAVPQPEGLLRKSVSLYAGWLTVASTVSVGNLLLQAGYRVPPRRAAGWAYGMLPVTGLLGLTVAKRLNDPYYLLPFVAAFLGIAAKQAGRQNGVAALAGTWAAITTARILRQAPARAAQGITGGRENEAGTL
jgi:tryptophan-rich sensory protein